MISIQIISLTLFVIITTSIITATSNETSTTMILRSCGKTRAENPEEFDGNFVDSMEILSQKISDSGFGISVAGAVNDSNNRVYGLGQCLNYLSNIDCRLCYAESRVNLPFCLPAISSHVYLNGCFLRYGNYNFSQESVSNGSDSSVCGSSKNVSNVNEFEEIANGLIQNLSIGAYEEREYYKEGNASLSSSGLTVYGIAQCWRSLNKSGCKDCLENARERIVGCLPGGSDGRALNSGCFLRYSLDPFYVNVVSSSPTGSSGNGRRRRVTVALASICAAIVVIGAAVLWRRRKASTRDDSINADGSSEILRSISKSHLSFKYEDLRKATNDFGLHNKIGQGGYGSVYKGVLPDGREIAVKRLFFQTTQWLEQFFYEVNLISSVQHKNLVKLYGCSVDGPEGLLVYEYLCNLSLDQFLFDSFRKTDLDWGRRFDILVGTAEGLAYLHKASEVRIIHRDIKASNILLDERFKPKIADFGLARYFAEGQSHLSTGVAGTLGYMAPEYVVHGQLTEKADVYSYGVLLLEMVTGRKNTNSITASTDGHSLMSQIWDNFTSNTAMEMLDPNLQGQCSEEQVLKVIQVGLLCIQASPNLRPQMWKVVEMLISNNSRDLPLPTQPPFINIKGAQLKSNGSETSGKSSSSYKNPVSTNQLSISIMEGR